MAVNNDNRDLVYEFDDNLQRELVRSITSQQCVYIRFINRVSRPVDVWWRDYKGKRRHYVRLAPRTCFNVDTYVTHPWEFTDPTTKENYVVNNKTIFRPPKSLAGMKHRTNWLISVRIRSLRSTAMLVIAAHVRDRSRLPELGLPLQLSNDLNLLISAIENTPPPPAPQT